MKKSKKNRFFFSLFLMGFFVFSGTQASFSDVPDDHPHVEAIEYLQSENIVQGHSETGLFTPDNTINRAAFTKILISSQYEEKDITACEINSYGFPDVEVSQWYASYICKAKSDSLVSGYPDGTFQPSSDISFVELAKIVGSSFHTSLTSDPWYKGYIEYLGDQKAIPMDILSFEQKITRGQMAEVITRLLQNDTSKASRVYEDFLEKAVDVVETVVEVLIDLSDFDDLFAEDEDFFSDEDDGLDSLDGIFE